MALYDSHRQLLEVLWRQRVQNELHRYREAREVCQKSLSDRGDIPSPDGSFAFQRALRVETAALKEYMRVLEIFNTLVVHRKMPPDE